MSVKQTKRERSVADPETGKIIGHELFVSDDVPAGAAETMRVQPIEGWMPADARSWYDGVTVAWPRSRLWRRFVVAGRSTGNRRAALRSILDMEHVKSAALGGFVNDYGPLRSRVALYDEPEKLYADAPTEPLPGSPRSPVSDSLTPDLSEYNPIVNAPGGRWIGPYQGYLPPREWWDIHVRTVDRCTAAWSEGTPETMLVDGKLPTSRFSLMARPETPGLSILPDGRRSTVAEPFRHDPMFKWMGSCGNAGYKMSHLIRQYRAAMACVNHFKRSSLLAHICGDDIEAMATDVAFALSHLPVKAGWDGDTTVGYPPGTWMNYEPLRFRPRRPQGPDGGRSLGWAAYLLANALFTGRYFGKQVHLEDLAVAFLDWTEDSLTPAGFIQAVKYNETGGPTPEECGVKSNELSAAEIETPIFAGGITALAVQVYGEDGLPEWVVQMLDRLAFTYLRFWPPGEMPDWPTYFICGELTPNGRVYYDLINVRPSPKRGKNFNAWWLLECALRFGKENEAAIRERKGHIEALWSKNPLWRPWMAGLMGAL